MPREAQRPPERHQRGKGEPKNARQREQRMPEKSQASAQRAREAKNQIESPTK